VRLVALQLADEVHGEAVTVRELPTLRGGLLVAVLADRHHPELGEQVDV
jgi:hypothetical protein